MFGTQVPNIDTWNTRLLVERKLNEKKSRDPLQGVDITVEALFNRAVDGWDTPAIKSGALLRADVRVGAYQPGAEPLGDAFWQLVDRADQLQSGAHATLTAKVHVLSGGQPLREELMQGRIDAAVQGCIGAGADAASTALGITPLPAALDTGLPYTLTWRLKASEAARQLAQAMQSPEAAQQWRALGLQTP